MGVSMGASNGFAVAALIDAEHAVPRQAWATPAEIALPLLAAVAGWWLAGPPPSVPRAVGTPPPGVPMLSLAPNQRAVYAVSTWQRAPLLQGAAFLALAWFWAPDFSPFWQQPTMAALLGVFLILQARTRLRVDGRGVEVTLSWLGGLRRTLPYDAVQFASARPRGSGTGPAA